MSQALINKNSKFGEWWQVVMIFHYNDNFNKIFCIEYIFDKMQISVFLLFCC